MNKFAELRQDVAFFNQSGIGILNRGRFAVIDGQPCPERNSLGLITLGNDGAIIRVRVPREAVSVLGGYTPAEGHGDRLYVGEFSGGDYRVTVIDLDAAGHALGNPRPLAITHRHGSAIGWGYDGDGPADLALSLIRDCLPEEAGTADACYFEFAREFVQRQPERGRWSTTATDLRRRIANLRSRAA